MGVGVKVKLFTPLSRKKSRKTPEFGYNCRRMYPRDYANQSDFHCYTAMGSLVVTAVEPNSCWPEMHTSCIKPSKGSYLCGEYWSGSVTRIRSPRIRLGLLSSDSSSDATDRPAICLRSGSSAELPFDWWSARVIRLRWMWSVVSHFAPIGTLCRTHCRSLSVRVVSTGYPSRHPIRNRLLCCVSCLRVVFS